MKYGKNKVISRRNRPGCVCVCMCVQAFEVCVPVGGRRGSSRKITYTNPYASGRTFLLRSDHPDLLQFKEDRFQVSSDRKSRKPSFPFLPSLCLPRRQFLLINAEGETSSSTKKSPSLLWEKIKRCISASG